ncbi:MAG: class D sortase [Trichococcus flocculiformis]
MKRLIGFSIIGVGLALVSLSLYELYETKTSTEKALAIAKTVIASQPEVQKDSEGQPIAQDYQQDDVIGILTIPKLDETYPIIEGTEEEMLAKGVGHYPTTALPGEKEQILLSGHRGTVFQRLGELIAGDRFIIDMGYGKFEYEMRESQIVAADDTTVIKPRGEEVLTLSTCYPFSYIGSAPDRYIIYAYPVTANATE